MQKADSNLSAFAKEKSMIIDAHTHTFPEKIADKVIAQLQDKAKSRAYTKGTDAALNQSMKEADIDVSVLLPVMTNPAQVEKLNSIAIEKNRNFGETGLFSLGGMHPDFEGFAAELKRLCENGITAIKLHPAYQNVDLDDIRYLRIIDKANELGLATVIHAGLDIGIMHHNFSSIKHICTVLKEINPEKFVLAHMGGWKCWDDVESTLAGENVYMDTAFSLGSYEPPKEYSVPKEETEMLGTEQFERIVKKHGCDKILFATDSPWSSQAETLCRVKACCFDSDGLEHILFKNAQKVYRIPNR